MITEESLQEARRAYEDCVPMVEIAGWYGVTRQALWKRFRAAGIETRKGKATRRRVGCDQCGVEYEVTRSKKRNFGKKHFCSDVCYKVYLENSDSMTNRHHQRIARFKVGEVFDLKDGHVVHHKDGNHFNTRLDNFMVFANNSDHIKYHHQLRQGEVTVKPIWDGSEHEISIADRIREKLDKKRKGVKKEKIAKVHSEESPRAKYKRLHPREMCPVCRERNKDCICGG